MFNKFLLNILFLEESKVEYYKKRRLYWDGNLKRVGVVMWINLRGLFKEKLSVLKLFCKEIIKI